MKIFMSWSGPRSKIVAERLRDWLPDVISNISIWVSSADIDAGARWNHEVQRELGETQFGVLCLTRSNMVAPWLLFEAGALAKGVEKSHVCPYLIDLQPAEIPPGPLTQFQAKRADRHGTWDLVKTINSSLGAAGVAEDRLLRRFEAQWSSLESSLASLPTEAGTAPPVRTSEEKLDEILELVRTTARREPLDFSVPPAAQGDLSAQLKQMTKDLKDPEKLREFVARAIYNGVRKHPEVHASGADILSWKGTENGPMLLVTKNGQVSTVSSLTPGYEHLSGNQLVALVERDLVDQVVAFATRASNLTT